MARYSLIMKDLVYSRLFTRALKQKKSMGKFLNELLEKESEAEVKVIPEVCCLCGGSPAWQGISYFQDVLKFCAKHGKIAKECCNGFRKL